MFQDKASSRESYDRFVNRVVAGGTVWGLRSEDHGWAHSSSNEHAEVDVILFWSDRAYAARHQKEEWLDYVPTEIALDEFIDAWLRGMSEDGVLAGPNWDANLCGMEVPARDLAGRLYSGIDNPNKQETLDTDEN